ncbi:MAG: penicillin-binding protein 2 [Sphingobacteriales bacterium]|jgi:penicillin-binding protein 2
MLVVTSLLFLRLFYIQVIDRSFVASAQSNVIRQVTVFPARGIIYDRNQKILVQNQAIYDLMVIPSQVKEMDTAMFCGLIGIDKETFSLRIKKAKRYSRFKASVFDKQLSVFTYATFQEKLSEFPGFYVVSRTVREYPDQIGGHVLGYVGEVGEKQIAQRGYYKSGDYIGVSGIESTYEKELRGKKGVNNIMVDVFNRQVGSYSDGKYDSNAVAGQDVVSSLDAELQKYGELLLQNKSGSIVAIEPKTGEILALVSSPGYDPNLLVGKTRGDNYMKLLNDKNKPLFNRAIMAEYPPGSIFKLAMALVAQKHNVFDENLVYRCKGYYKNGRSSVGCRSHPNPVKMESAIQFSCNAYFCQALKNIIDFNPKYSTPESAYKAWYSDMLKLGFGEALGIDIGNELDGNLPKSTLYDKMYGAGRWKASTIISLGIGQGELGITPIQMANFMAILANRGFYYIPHLVKNYPKPEYNTKIDVDIDSAYFVPVINGMEKVVNAGTAARIRMKDVVICGKTGTVQNPHGEDHSVFVGFAPKDDPKIAIAVVIENSGGGSSWAAPTAGLMIEKYLNRIVERKWMEQQIMDAKFIKEKPMVVEIATETQQKVN